MAGEAAARHKGLGFGEGFFCPQLSHVWCPSGARVPVLPHTWGGPNCAPSHEPLATFPGGRGFSKICCSSGCFHSPPPSPNLFGFAGRAKQGLQRLMKKAAGSSYKIKRLEQIGVPSLGKQKLRAAQGERCADGSQGTPCGRR